MANLPLFEEEKKAFFINQFSVAIDFFLWRKLAQF